MTTQTWNFQKNVVTKEEEKPIFTSPEPEVEYDDGQGRRFDILDDEIA